ncbi:class 1 integron integrase protein IntI1 [Escherichia coli]|nr:class 1 integron integrase protein IntI1 [Escherichia coli]
MKTATAPLPPLRSVKVLDQLRERIRYLHYSLRTEQAYVHWVRAFIRFHGVRHPATLGSSEVEAFLSWLANERKVSVSTHRQAVGGLAVLLRQGAVHGSALASGDRKTSAVAALAGGADPG